MMAMSPKPLPTEALIEGLMAGDQVVLERSWPSAAIEAMRAEAGRLAEAGVLTEAAVGRGRSARVVPAVRADRRVWLEGLDRGTTPAFAALVDDLEGMRAALNRRLLLGVDEVEAQLACYPAGGGYARHLDRFADDEARVLSLVLYLNDRWCDADGGALRLHAADGSWRDVAPAAGTLVAFLSDRVEHEVLPATRTRWSVAAWFRRRPRSTGAR